MKLCTLCKSSIPVSYTSNLCTKCRKKQNYINNNGKFRARLVRKTLEEKNLIKKEASKRWYANNKCKIKKPTAEYKKKKQKEWYDKRGREYYQTRYITDLNFRLRTILRSRLNCAIKNNQKAGSAVNDLGCSIEELKGHLESKFTDKMNWDNYGTYWEIDHINGLAQFNLSNEEEFKKACHYTNLQPLPITENRSKG